MKVGEVIRRLQEDGWTFARQGGRASHRVYKKDGVRAQVSIPGRDSDDVSPGVLSDIRRKSGLPLR